LFGNWLRRRIELAGVQSGTQDLERFVASLHGMSDTELATLVVIATAVRVSLRMNGQAPDEAYGLTNFPPKEQAIVQLFVSGLVKKFQTSGRQAYAAGAMVWLHTLRAGSTPELRLLGRRMWGELTRGFPHVSEAIEDMGTVTGDALPPEVASESNFIPPGLEPLGHPEKGMADELRAMTASALTDVKSKWIQFDSTIKLKADVPLSVKMDTFVQPITLFIEKRYPALMHGPPELFWLTIFTAILESGTHAKDEVNAAIGELKKKYGPEAPRPA
jgi:hypothetical protein